MVVPVSAPRGADEPSQAYIDRLLGLNDTLLTGSAYAVSSGGVGSVLGGFTFGQATRVLPVLSKTLDVTWTNVGSATAATVDATALVDNEAVVVTGVPILWAGRFSSLMTLLVNARRLRIRMVRVVRGPMTLAVVLRLMLMS